MRKVRVLVVEDSVVVRELLCELIARDPRLEVAGAVGSAEEALRLLAAIDPDVISLDIRLPGMNGLEATRRIMSERPTPIVVVSASVEAEDLRITMSALEAGALSVVEKPSGESPEEYERVARSIREQLVAMSEVKVVRRRRSATPTSHRGGEPLVAGPYRAVGIVASTGGPGAVARILRGLGDPLPVPVLLVQHMAPAFLEGFVRWLGEISRAPVSMARDRERPEPRRVYVAPGDRCLTLENGVVRLRPVDGDGLRSGSVLLESLGRALGAGAVGVVLTGMGDDGAQGLLEIRRRGGLTIAESSATAVVYGMPEAAVRMGAASEVLPLDAIAARLRRAFREPEGVVR